MSLQTLELMEVGATFISFLTLIFATLGLYGAWHDWQDAKEAGDKITPQASEMARERLVTGQFLFFMAVCLLLSSVYSVVLLRSTTIVAELSGYMTIQLQAFVLRTFWRVSVLGFAFVRWSTRERIRRELLLT